MSVGLVQLTPYEIFQIERYLKNLWLPGAFGPGRIRNRMLTIIGRAYSRVVNNYSV